MPRGDHEAAREATGKAASLRAKESLSTGWAARLCCEQRVRLAAVLASSVACASEFKPLARSESAREREPRERGPGLRVPVCVCAVIALGVPLLASSDQRNGHL